MPDSRKMTSEGSGSDGEMEEYTSYLEETIPVEISTSEAQDKVNPVPLSPNCKRTKLSPRRPSRSSTGANGERKRQSVSNSSQKAEGKSRKKGRCNTVSIGEPSASQPPEPEGENDPLEEVIEKSVPKAIKNLRDRLYRRIENMPDMKSFMRVASKTSVDLGLIQSRWPVLSALKNTMEEIDEINQKNKESKGTDMEMEVTKEVKNRLRDILKKLKVLDKQRREDSKKVDNLVKDFTAEGVNLKTQKEKFFEAFSWSKGEIEPNDPTATQDQGSSRTREQLQNELFAMHNNVVDVLDFPGLKEAIEKSNSQWNVPGYLEPIAIKIQMVRGITTEFEHIDIQRLVCAAIHEMEHLPINALNWPTLLRWGATLNKAAQLGFFMEFAENLLLKNLIVYFDRFKIR